MQNRDFNECEKKNLELDLNGNLTATVADTLINDPELEVDDIFGGASGETAKIYSYKDKNAEEAAFSDIKEQKYGKFKNPEELLKAYRELEKAFTKKAQRLKELERTDANLSTPPHAEIGVDEEVVKYVCENGNVKSGTDGNEVTEFRRDADKFFKEIPAAMKYAGEIAEQFVLRPELNNAPQPLERALLGVLAAKIRTPEQMLSDGQFLDGYVLKNEEIKKAVLENYLKELGRGLPPVTLSYAGNMASVPEKQPKSIEEAGKMFLKNND